MRKYESVIIVRPGAAAEAEITAVSDKYAAVISEYQGEVASVNHWGLKRLAYPVKKENQGFYLLLRYLCNPDGIKEMERLLRIDDRILKFLTVRLDDDLDISGAVTAADGDQADQAREDVAEESAAA